MAASEVEALVVLALKKLAGSILRVISMDQEILALRYVQCIVRFCLRENVEPH
jgi:hypothetical protein